MARAVRLGRAFAAVGALIILTVTEYSQGYTDAPRGKADAPMALPPNGLPPNFAVLVPEIDALPATVRLTKRQMSAFFGTELDLQLRRRNIRAVVICGVATNMGVEGTARAAFELDYDVVIASDACGSVSTEFHDFAIEKMLPRIARVRATTAILAEFPS